MRRSLPAIALIVLLASCVAAPGPAPVRPAPARPGPVPVPRPLPPAVPAAPGADWNDWPYTPGDWRYARMGGGTVARFSGGQVLAELRCDPTTRLLTLARFGGAAAGGALTVRTTTLSRVLPTDLTTAADGAATSTSRLGASDPLLDAIAFSRGRFVIDQKGAPPLVLPPYAEIGRVIEDCRG